jgi:dihydropyrimidinase
VNADSIQTNVDIYIEDGKIKFIGSTADSICPGGVKVIDCAGKFVFPGGVDASTHFVQSLNGDTPIDDFYSGTKASVAGGTTTVIDLILPQREESLIEAYDIWRSKADGKAVCDYGLRCGITWYIKNYLFFIIILLYK